jgi:hypothetical protein
MTELYRHAVDDRTIELVPGERVKIIIDGAYLTGEVVSRSKHDPNEWVIRTYFHGKLTLVDSMHIVSDRRERFYQNLLTRGTIVEVEDSKAKRVGIIVDAITKELDDQSFVYIPIVLIGTSKKPYLPESLRVIQCNNESAWTQNA